MLARVADLTWQRPKTVLAIVGAFAVLSVALGRDLERHLKAAGFTDSASESERATATLRGALGYDPNAALFLVVRDPGGRQLDVASPGVRREVARLSRAVAGLEHVGRVVNPLRDRRLGARLIARDGESLVVTVH